VRFPGLIHPGIVGCAPSPEVLAEWNRREGELIAANTLDRDVAKPPEPKNAHAGAASEDIKEKVAREGARTIPVCAVQPVGKATRPSHGSLSLIQHQKWPRVVLKMAETAISKT
jgi:hypothetical protein